MNIKNDIDLREIFNLYYSDLCVFACKYVDNFDQAEDIVQNMFIDFWENRRFENLHLSLKSYLFTSVKNNALKYIRDNKKFRFEDIEACVSYDIGDQFRFEDLQTIIKDLYRKIEDLPPQRRRVFKAIVFEKLKYSEVAENLQISVNTVKTHYSRAVKHLKQAMIYIF